MKVNGLKINKLVEIEVDSFACQGIFPSRIEEVLKNELHLAVPILHGALVPLRVGESIRVYYTFRNDAYFFNTRVMGRKQKPIPVLIVDYPHEVVKIQRRNWVRLEASLPIFFQTLDGEEVGEGLTVDISGGGVLFFTEFDWPKANDLLQIKLDLPEEDPFICTVRILRVIPQVTTGSRRYQIACEFEGIREGQRDVLVKYIFIVQRERIKKGLL